MKKIVLYIFLLVFTAALFGQDDPEAKKILDEASVKTKSYKTIEADFELVIENKIENHVSNSTGKIKIKGEKYYLESMGSRVYFDGIMMWTYLVEENEVVITEPDPEDNDFMENPALIFSFYDRDFKLRLVGETKLDDRLMYEIDLYPKNLDQPYSRFKLFIDKEKKELYQVSAIGKEGMVYSAYIRNTIFNKEMKDEIFEFDPSKYDDIIITDMRF